MSLIMRFQRLPNIKASEPRAGEPVEDTAARPLVAGVGVSPYVLSASIKKTAWGMSVPEQSVRDLSEIIDSRRMGPVHWIVVVVSFVLMLIDGYDLSCASFVAPLLQKEWGFDKASFGLLFSSATMGTAVGPLIFGAAADKLGRKPVLLLGTIWFGLLTLGGVMASSLQQMLILRFVAGIGIGGVIATAIAYVSEFAPKRIRATMIVMGVVGLALGGGVGAIIASKLLATYTWRSMFWIGGLAPLALALLGIFVIPESPKYLALSPDRSERLTALVRRLAPELNIAPGTIFRMPEQTERFTYAAAFKGNLAVIVPLLMLTTFLAQFALFFVNQWTLVLLTSGGVPITRATWAPGAFQILGFVGALAITRPVDRFGCFPIPLLFIAAAAVIACIGIPGIGDTATIALSGAAGFCIIGLQFGNIAATGQVFPTPIRSGGVGLIYGVGRIGSFVGPGLAGLLIAAGVSLNTLFFAVGALMLVGATAGFLLSPRYARHLR
jgi:AAHS family 4-hydroxybenzoate transporter-like MFS transporter